MNTACNAHVCMANRIFVANLLVLSHPFRAGFLSSLFQDLQKQQEQQKRQEEKRKKDEERKVKLAAIEAEKKLKVSTLHHVARIDISSHR